MSSSVALGIRFALDVALKATLLFAATGLALFALRRASAATRHLVGTAGLVAALALPLLTLALPRIALPVLPGLPLAGEIQPSSAAAVPGAGIEESPRAGRSTDPFASQENLSAPPAATPSAPPARRAGNRLPWLGLALLGWALGALVVGTRLAVGWARVRRIAREAAPLTDGAWIGERDAIARGLGLRRQVSMLESSSVPVAMTSGFLRPLLLLGRAARTWAIERRRVVLLHELAHVKRGDWLWLLVAEAVVALFWFHPAAWLLAREVRNDAEEASDDLVLAAGTKPSVYAGHLLGIFRSLGDVSHPAGPVLAIARPSHFERRLRAILEPVVPRGKGPGARARLFAAALFAAAAAIAAVEPWTPALAGAADGRSNFAQSPAMPAPIEAEVREEFVRASNGRQTEKASGSSAYSRGMELHRAGRYDEAIEAFKRSIEAGHREGAASYNIACGYALKGDRDKAFDWLDRSMDEGFEIVSYLERDDDLDNLRSDPRWKEFKKTARERRSSRQQDEAAAVAKHYEQLVARAPRDGAPFFEIGRELLNANRYDLSARAFAAAAERGYRSGTSLYNEACALSRDGQTRAAIDLLEKALDNGFDQPDLFEKDDDLDNVRDDPRFAALEREARALSLPGFLSAWSSLGLPGSKWKWRESASKFEEYARAHPQEGRAWFNLGYASLAGNRPEAAAEAFQKALDLGYRKPTTLYNLACSYARLDQRDKAFDWLFKALDAGFPETGTLRGDKDLDNLRGDLRFRKALEIAKAKERAEED